MSDFDSMDQDDEEDDEDDDDEFDEKSQDEMEEDDNNDKEMKGGMMPMNGMEFSDDDDDSEEGEHNFPTQYGTRELLNLLTTLVLGMHNDEQVKKLLPQILNFLKTEYSTDSGSRISENNYLLTLDVYLDNLRLPNFYTAMTACFLTQKQTNSAEVADQIAASVVDFLRHTNLQSSQVVTDSFYKVSNHS